MATAFYTLYAHIMNTYIKRIIESHRLVKQSWARRISGFVSLGLRMQNCLAYIIVDHQKQ